MKKIIFIFFLFINLSFASLQLQNPKPLPDSTFFGRDSDEFGIEINEAGSVLNTSSVKVYYRVKDPTSIWSYSNLNCISLSAGKYYCNGTISGLESLLRDGSKLLYYFTASSTENIVYNYGNSESPLEILADRSAPTIEFLDEFSFVGKNKQVVVRIRDSFSNVDSNKVFYRVGNSSYNSSWFNLNSLGGYLYTTNFDFSQFPSNSTIFVYVNASDVVGNLNSTKGNYRVDSEKPIIIIIKPDVDIINGNVEFGANITEMLSGIKNSTLYINNSLFQLSCYNNYCYTFVDTLSFPDGNYLITFEAFDNVDNYGKNQTQLRIVNRVPSINFANLNNDSYISKSFNLSILISNVRELRDSKIYFQNSSYTTPKENLSCIDFVCNYYLDVSKFSESKYKVVVEIVDENNIKYNNSVFFTIDRTKPNITLLYPTTNEINNTVNFSFYVNDNFELDRNSLIVEFGNIEMITVICSENFECFFVLDTKNLQNGNYILKISVKDKAGNEDVFSKSFYVNNFGAPGYTQGQVGQVGQGTGGTGGAGQGSQPSITNPITRIINSITSNERTVYVIKNIRDFIFGNPTISIPTISFLSIGLGFLAYKFLLKPLPRQPIFEKLINRFDTEKNILKRSFNSFIEASSTSSIETFKYKCLIADEELSKISIEEKISGLKAKDKGKELVEKFKMLYNLRNNYIKEIRNALNNFQNVNNLENVRERITQITELYQKCVNISEEIIEIFNELNSLTKS